MTRIACALMMLCLLCSPATAKQAKLGSVSLNLPPPAGYCELSEAQPGDARMMTTIGGMLEKSGNRLLAISADCKQLDDWRAGRRPLLANYAQYQTLKAWEISGLPAPPAEIIKATCTQLRTQGDSLTTAMTPAVQSRIEEAMKAVKVNEMKFLGVLGQGPNVCYASLLQRIRAQTGADIVQVIVFATTIIKSKVVYYYLFAPYASGQTVYKLLDQLRTNVAALEASNRN